MNFALYLSVFFQDTLFSKYGNNSLLPVLFVSPWNSLKGFFVGAGTIFFIYLLSENLDNYFLLTLTVIIVGTMMIYALSGSNSLCIYKPYIVLVVISMFFDLIGIARFFSEYLEVFYKGYHETGRLAGMSREPSYLAEYIHFCTILLMINKRYVYSFFWVVFSFMLTSSGTVILYASIAMIAILGVHFTKLFYSHNNKFKGRLALLIIFSIGLVFLNISGFVDWSFEEKGSWRTISNYIAIVNSSFLPKNISEINLLIDTSYDVTWVQSIYSFVPYILFTNGWILGGVYFYIIFGKLTPILTRDNSSKRLVSLRLSSLLIWALFSPKWCFIVLFSLLFKPVLSRR